MSGKSALKRVLPAPLVTAGSWMLDRSLPTRRANRAAVRYHQQIRRVVSELIARHGPVVQGGPFAGLRFLPKGSWGSLAPLLVGSYEEELHVVLEELIAAAPRRIINVGCAEGYYAVGLAQRLPDADVYAFDIDERGQQIARKTAQINGVDGQVHIAGACTVERLEELLTTQTVVIMDCEGCELELLHPERAPSLRAATLLVELHDFVDPQISSMILARFRATHSSRLLTVGQRTISNYPVVQDLEPSDRAAALDELRPTDPHPMEWVVLCPLPADSLSRVSDGDTS
jgi:hypothetical protein